MDSPTPLFDPHPSASFPASALWPWPRLVAHRGAGTLAPENTLEAIELGSSMGWLGAEFDAMLSRDGHPALIHDETLARTTGRSGRVDHTDSDELFSMGAGSWLDPRWSHALVPPLSRVLARCAKLAHFCNIEIKPSSGHERATGLACAEAALRAFPPSPSTHGHGLVLLSSFSRLALAAARERAPALPRALLLERGEGRRHASWLGDCARLGCSAVHAHHSDGSPAFIAAARAAGLGSLFYTVDDPELGARLLRQGAGALCCDDLLTMGRAFPSLLAPARAPLGGF